MRGLRRDPSVPADVRDRLELVAGERVLAAASDESGHWHVGTDSALHVSSGDGWLRIPWERIDRARYDDDSDLLQVVEVADLGEPEPTHSLSLRQPRRLLDLVRDRVTASILISRHVPVQGSRGIKVIARRSPVGGPVEWSFLLATGLDPDAPEVRAAFAAGQADAESELGL